MLVAALPAVGGRDPHPAADQVRSSTARSPTASGNCCCRSALAAIALGVAQAALNFLRRWAQASAVTGMERDMRDDLYAHLQRLEPGFHDALAVRPAAVPGDHRPVGDPPVRRVRHRLPDHQPRRPSSSSVALLIHLNWWLGLLDRAASFVPVAVALLPGSSSRYRVLSRRAQDQQGDLATYVEEATAGIRVLKALGRRGEAAAPARRAGPAGVPRPRLTRPRLRGSFWAPARPDPERRDRPGAAARRAGGQPRTS